MSKARGFTSHIGWLLHSQVSSSNTLRTFARSTIHTNYCCAFYGYRTAFVSTATLLSKTRYPSHLDCLQPSYNGGRLRYKSLSTDKPIREKRETIVTIPNILSTIRICATPGIGYCIMTGQFTPALALTFAAGVTDLLDGFIARRFPSQASVLGSVLDPAADKILVSTLVITLTLTKLLPVWLCLLIVGRDAALVAAVSYLRFTSLSPPRTLVRFFDAGHPTVQLKPTLISKVNTLLQLGLVWCSLAAPVFDFVGSPFLVYLHYLVGSTTFITAIDYVRKTGTFRVLRDSEKS